MLPHKLKLHHRPPDKYVMRPLLLILFTLSLTACAKEDAESGASDPLFKTWTNSTDATQFNLTGGHFGQAPITYAVSGVTCECVFSINGFREMGDIEVSSCAIGGHTSHSTCDGLNERYTYSVSATGLMSVCPYSGGACDSYY
jgi:hypothetical protein